MTARWLLILLGLSALLPARAEAYLDPGAGSLVLQGLIAAVVGAGLTLKLFWRRLRNRLGGRPPRDDDPDRDRDGDG